MVQTSSLTPPPLPLSPPSSSSCLTTRPWVLEDLPLLLLLLSRQIPVLEDRVQPHSYSVHSHHFNHTSGITGHSKPTAAPYRAQLATLLFLFNSFLFICFKCIFFFLSFSLAVSLLPTTESPRPNPPPTLPHPPTTPPPIEH